MSMAGTGLISRLCGEVFRVLPLTFGAVGKASAPGQMNAADLKAEIFNIDPPKHVIDVA